MKLLNTAVIGAGAIHGCHVNALRQLPNVALRALADIDSVKGLKLALGYQCRFYQDYREMLLDDAIDVVHICTPHFEHKSMILAALAAGKHVFCEKPVGMNSSELVDITRAAEQATGLLGVCYQNRLNPTSLRIRQALDEGELGKMLSIKAVLTWSRSGAYYTQSPWRGRLATEGGSLLINQAIHTLDLMQWFAGGVTRVKGVVDSGELAEVTEGEDSAMATLHFANGARGLFYASNCNTTDSPLLMEIHCEQGSLLLNDNTLWCVTPGERVRLTSDGSPDGSAKSYWGLGHEQAIRHFYQAITHPGNTNYTGIREAGKSLTLVEAICRSSQLRQWIEINK
ncbi:TPA: Gfo/Idh/MocA family protein [Enterobacter cloacae]|uniref:Gfo/Idh/MocA family protein n=1 Tax=Enterobacter cloacae complex TaxID=354276 RepID=UPI001B833949|nr:Gfo/Idh/MocA family oxidoreductase [Enterobacter cloacae]MCM7171260.1 Gfo/Idh/MocA family oxidoreductase [Enterobacter cloacae]MDT0535514.1 Gfo/Idh/MocA family oxidoreductase [Enterobacter cloacae]UPW32410.1 Gfo/Idh/MocA family oxidoreductase [Enterobacter cloacae]HBC2538074.1 Gfo/Idh/MocA family oxidoreductase [Enterobacter cloacae]HBC2546152.1 Gfo/Idh/MocA family oxidoreductase [Enterobacter cloacae]